MASSTAVPKDESKGDKSDSSKQSKKSIVFSTTTIRKLPWSYFHLALVTPSSIGSNANKPALDELTARMHLTSALSQFLGLMGTAIPIDILKVEGSDAWIRVPSQDSNAVNEALSAWVGNEVAWRIRGRGSWLGGLAMGNERDLFEGDFKVEGTPTTGT